MWWVSLSAATSVTRKLPTTVARIGLLCVNRLTCGRAADAGGRAEPRTVLLLAMPGAASPASVTGAGGSSTATFGAAAVASEGSTSQVRCSPTRDASDLTTLRQLSIAPVGQGEMQARQALQTSTFTT